MSWWKGKPDEATLLKRRTIMLVDDDMPARITVTRLLEKKDYVVIACVDGQDAVETYREKHDSIGIVLLDMKMPRMDGHVAFHELRKINPDVKVILNSGFSVDTYVNECLDAGALGFLSKPFMKHELYALLEKHLADA